MAVPISTDPAVYYINFATGNGDTAPLYTDYAPDMDDNFTALRDSLNQAIQEISAIGGQNAVIALDLVTAQGIMAGRIGSHSYVVSVNGGDAAFVDVTAGSAIGGTSTRVESVGTVQVGSSGGAGTRYISIDANGVPQANVGPAAGVLDLISITWDSVEFTPGTEVLLADILPDGDDLIESRKRPATGQWTARTAVTSAFKKIADRFQAIEAAITGIDLDDSESPGLATSKLGLRGTVGAPGLFLSDGVSVFETDSGLYRATIDQMGFAATGTLRALFGTFGIRMQNGSAATPSIAGNSDPDTGFYWEQTPDLLGIAVAGNAVVAVGAAASLAFEINAAGQINLPLQFRVRAVNAAEEVADAIALADVLFQDGEEVYDVGGWHSGSSPNFTVPADGDGTYEAKLNAKFDLGNALGERRIAIVHEGTVYGEVLVDAATTTGTGLSTSIEIEAVATDVFKVQAGASDTAVLDCKFEFSLRKVA